MIRLLLTFLAVLTGLGANADAASARMCNGQGAEIGVIEALRSGDRAVPCPTSSARPEATVEPARKATRAPLPRKPVYIPTVQFGPDRAYE